VSNVSYASAVGNLMYVMLCTRSDIYFTVVSWFGKSWPKQPRTYSLSSRQENHEIPSWYCWLGPLQSR